jgi:proteasome beta subunit
VTVVFFGGKQDKTFSCDLTSPEVSETRLCLVVLFADSQVSPVNNCPCRRTTEQVFQYEVSMSQKYQDVKTGTTTVGIIFQGGVVLATERRATMGTLIASKKAKKVHSITNHIGMTIAGGVGDAQQLVRIISVECNLYQIRRGKEISVGAAATILSNYLNQNRFSPYYVQLLVGGVDTNGPSIYSVDAAGGATIEENFVATGSGSLIAYGVLEDRFKLGMNEDEVLDLAIRALRAAMQRDTASGEGYNIVIITRDKFEYISETKIAKMLPMSSPSL